jgi:hypothetical protein
LLVLVALITAALVGLARAVALRRRGAQVPVVVWHVLSGLTAAQGIPGATVHYVAILQLLVSLVAGIGVLVPGVFAADVAEAGEVVVNDDRRAGPA